MSNTQLALYAATLLRTSLGILALAHGLLKMLVLARYVCIAMIPILLGATSVHVSAGWLFSNEGRGWEFPAFWAVALVVQALLGDGKFALRFPATTPGMTGATPEPR